MPNFIYGPSTGNSNLRYHLYKVHPEDYDEAILKHGWNYKLSTQTNSTFTHNNKRKTRDEGLPPFSPETFLEYLVQFVVANDEVCLNFLVFSRAR